MKNHLSIAFTLLVVCGPQIVLAQAPLTSAFTYQGQLRNSGSLADGVFDLRFSLWDSVAGGVQSGATICRDNISVVEGLFTASLDFGAQFNGDARFLEISVRPGGPAADCAVGTYTALSPRQALTAAPYALYALSGPGSGGPWTVSGNNIFSTNTGNVGIGDNSPSARLSILGVENTTFLNGVLQMSSPGGTLGHFMTLDGNEINGWSDLHLNPETATDVLLAGGGGNVGIGTSIPNAKLHVSVGRENTTLSDGSFIIHSVGGTLGQIMTMDGNEINGWTHLHLNPHATTDIVMVAGGGNVGIASANPAARLHVEGGTDTELGGGGYIVCGSVAGTNLSIDNNEIEARDNGAAATLALNNDGGDVSIAPQGTTRVRVLEITGADVAEKFAVSDKPMPGMVMEIDPDNAGKLRIARGAYNRRVAGVVSGANGLPAGTILGNLPGSEEAPPVALSGRVWVFCDASEGAIELGDLLTSSATAGHAMKVADYPRAQGAAIGKAMTSLARGETGMVLVLVNLQ